MLILITLFPRKMEVNWFLKLQRNSLATSIETNILNFSTDCSSQHTIYKWKAKQIDTVLSQSIFIHCILAYTPFGPSLIHHLQPQIYTQYTLLCIFFPTYSDHGRNHCYVCKTGSSGNSKQELFKSLIILCVELH